MSSVQTSVSLLALSVLVESLMSSYLGEQWSAEAKLTKIAERACGKEALQGVCRGLSETWFAARWHYLLDKDLQLVPLGDYIGSATTSSGLGQAWWSLTGICQPE